MVNKVRLPSVYVQALACYFWCKRSKVLQVRFEVICIVLCTRRALYFIFSNNYPERFEDRSLDIQF